MRTVLIGADFMYDQNGNLKPIEINTNSTLNQGDLVEDISDVFDFTELETFITTNNFTNLVYIGSINELDNELKSFSESKSLSYTYYNIGGSSLTVPYIEDNDTTLIIRSAFDTTAIIDDTYCADKFNFVELVGNSSFGIEYALINTDGNLVNTITNIPNNGDHPNFILKSKYPGYDLNIFPKLFKVSTQEQLDQVISQNVTNEYLLETFLFNESKLHNGSHIPVIRSYNLLYPPTLQSISLGQNTLIPPNSVLISSSYNETTYELNSADRNKYITSQMTFGGYPRLRDTDRVLMADGTWKAPNELVVGDYVKSISIPNPDNVDTSDETADYGINIDTFNSGSSYVSNKITSVNFINTLDRIATITFTDGSVWSDGRHVSFLTYNNNDVMWKLVTQLVAGDQLVTVDTNNETSLFTELKTVQSVELTKEFFVGWVMSVEDSHLYIVKDTTHNNVFALFEHNLSCQACGQLQINQCSVCTNKTQPACAQRTAPSAICVAQT